MLLVNDISFEDLEVVHVGGSPRNSDLASLKMFFVSVGLGNHNW